MDKRNDEPDDNKQWKRLKGSRQLKHQCKIFWSRLQALFAIARLFFEKPRLDRKQIRRALRRLVFLAYTRKIIDKAEFAIIKNAISLQRIKVSTLKTPRVQANFLRPEMALRDLYAAKKPPLSGYWLVTNDDNVDDVVGVISIHDVFAEGVNLEKNVGAIMKEPTYIPKGISILSALEKLEEAESEIAIIIDEYGGVDGFIKKTTLLNAVMKGALARKVNHPLKGTLDRIFGTECKRSVSTENSAPALSQTRYAP